MDAPQQIQEIPYATVAEGFQPYADMDTAVRSAFQAIQALSKDSEYAGALFKNAQGQFTYTTPLGGTNHDFKYKLRIPKNHTLAGIYHNHPPEENALSQYFSQGDIDMIRKINVPSYVMDNSDARIRYMTPENAKRINAGDIRRRSDKLLGEILKDLTK